VKDALLNYVKLVKARHEKVKGNKQATKSTLIGPLFTLLGYDLADPQECVPEFKADFGKARSVKPVDWAFYQNGRPIFLVEAKDAGSKLGGYDEQLGDYFAKEPNVKLGILTNGVKWRFFTDIMNANVMDKEPFVKWDVLNDEQPPYDFLTLLQKSQFKTELVRTFAQRQHEHNLLINELARLLEPSAEFTRLAIANIETRNLTATVVESWKPVVASAIGEWAKQRTLATVLNKSPSQDETNSSSDEQQKNGKKAQLRETKKTFEANLQDLIGAGLLTPPLRLFRKYKGKLMEARLLPQGTVEFEGQTFNTSSSAAEFARSTVTGRKMQTNGWSFWQYLDAAEKTLTLYDAREKFLAMKRGEA
jgi:predicted type IV restriction endonuclease